MNLLSDCFYLPRVSLRLSPLQLNAIRPGLLLIIHRYQATLDTGEYHYSYPYYLHPRPGFDFGEFDPDFMNIVRDLGNRFPSGPGCSWRLQLNAIELAICIFAARITAKQRRHGHLAAAQTKSAPLTRLVRTLERHRKRALRLIPAEVFRDYSRRWRRLLQWIRVHLLFCGCQKVPYRSNRQYKMVLQDCTFQARAGLLARQVPVPDDARLRALVRQALRYVRRDRTDFGIRQLITNHQLARNYFSEFIINRETKRRKQ